MERIFNSKQTNPCVAASVELFNQGSDVFAEFSGTFWTLWSRKLRFWKGIYVIIKCFIDALISTFFVRWLQNASRFWDRFCAEFCHVLCRFYLHWWIHDPDNLMLIALKDYLFGFWKKAFQVTASLAIVLSLFIHKISLKHDSDTSASKLSLHTSVNNFAKVSANFIQILL